MQKIIDNQQEVIDELKAQVEELQTTSSEKEDKYIIYIVQNGDTLSKICASLGIDYWKNRDVILNLNNISNENIILVGQTLIFPKSIQNY